MFQNTIFGLLAQLAIDYLENNKDNQNVKDLYCMLCNVAKGWLK